MAMMGAALQLDEAPWCLWRTPATDMFDRGDFVTRPIWPMLEKELTIPRVLLP